ncbi:MAG: acetate--CoA ligase [Bacteroidota bacterium]|nr:acetate--CoA ligase [Bacteroidota bacterium]
MNNSTESTAIDFQNFWAQQALNLHWRTAWDTVQISNSDAHSYYWFQGGYTNMCYNCLDRHIPSHGDKIAIITEPNELSTPSKSLSYSQLHTEVCKLANALIGLGVSIGDRVGIYMPMIPETIIAMLACARIGAIHTVIFAGFSAHSLRDRLIDCGCRIIIAANAMYRGNKKIILKDIVDEALLHCEDVWHSIIFKNTDDEVNMLTGRDLDWSNLIDSQSTVCDVVWVESEHPLFILYTSGSTGKPKGLVHTTGGYMVQTTWTMQHVFEMKHEDVFWCTADVGWITGHSYVAYGPMLNANTQVMYEGIPTYPSSERMWQIVEKHHINILYTSPTLIRSLMVCGIELPNNYKMQSLKVLGSVGEPINEEAWHWYHTNVGKDNCPILDTWWQTETGNMLMSPSVNELNPKPGYTMNPLLGVVPVIMDVNGVELTGNNIEGNLCLQLGWPSMARTIWNDHPRYITTYFSTYVGYYFTGDGCKRDADGHYRITGRVDDVINVSGHRIGTGELESAINEHSFVIESAVVGYPHDIKGQGIYAFVSGSESHIDNELVAKEIKAWVAAKIGPFARPDKVQVVKTLPKTRSGKIMRRILRKIAEGQFDSLGDTSTLIDPSVVDAIILGRV